MDKQTAFAFCMIGFAILGTTLTISNSFDVSIIFADEIEANPIILQDSKNDYYYEYGQLTKSVHGSFDRLLDYTDSLGNPVYVDYKQYDNGDNINFETGTKSFSLNKSTCSLGIYDGGKILDNSVKIKTLSHTFKQATNGTDDDWVIHPSSNEDCSLDIQNKRIIITKSNVNNSTGLSYDVIYYFDQNGSVEL